MSSPNDFQDLSQIRHVEQGDPVAAQVTSQPTRALELRLNALFQLVKQLQSSSETGKLIIFDVNIQTVGAAAVSRDDIVFFNANTGVYEQALAAITAVTAGFVSNPTAFFLGVVVAVRGAKADVMIGGYDQWVDVTQQQAMLEGAETYQPGIPYFLSALEPGKLTRYAPTLRIQVLIGTDKHFILSPAWSTPEAIENIYAVLVGMRPVGATRAIAPDYEHNIIVGFDALEKYSELQQAWRTTKESSIPDVRQFGYLVADATVTAAPASMVYIGMEVATNGTITVYSAGSLADLYVGGPQVYNVSTPLALADNNKDTLRGYAVYDTSNVAVGTVSFRFVSIDRSFPRKLVFKFPEDFQGWKMVNAPVSPLATATLASGQITGIVLSERSVGFDTPPTIVIEDSTGSGASARALLDDWGSIAEVQLLAPGSNYTNPTIIFDSQVIDLAVMNGGSGAAATASAADGEITNVTLVAGGTGYLSNPDVVVLDAAGAGVGAVILAIVRHDAVVEFKISNPGQNYTAPILMVIPPRNRGYQLTVPGEFHATVISGAITSALVTTGGFNYPAGAQVKFLGIGTGAAATVVLDAHGTVTGITMTSSGSGYDGTTTIVIDEKTPQLLIAAGDPDTQATGHLNFATMGIERLEIISEGIAYSSLMTLTPSGGLGMGGVAAQLKPILDGAGRVIDVQVIDPGSGYLYAPTLAVGGAGDGNGLRLAAVMGTQIISATVDSGGRNYQSRPTTAVGLPLEDIQVESGGTGYTDVPDVTIDAPNDPDGIQATAEAVLGAGISNVVIIASGAGYTDPDNTSISVTGGGGTGAVLLPIYLSGQLVDVVVLETGSGYTSAPALTVNAVDGSGAVLTAHIDGEGSVIKINLICPGSGYTTSPQVTIVPSAGIAARAHANLLGGTADLVVQLSGSGGLRMLQTSELAQGNALQISHFHDDLDDGPVIFPAPLNAALYYNIKSDLSLQSRYPAVPLEKAAFVLNGVELVTSPFNELQLTSKDPAADIVLARKTIFWPGMDSDGSPWDREFSSYIQAAGAGGRDNVIPKTGFDNDATNWWRLWANTFLYESGRNRAWMHINKTSRFAASGKVVSIGVMSPLKAVDVVSGVESNSDGSPLSGQIMLTLDNQVNLLADPSDQVDLTNLGNLTAIYANNTGRMVLISSILLNVTFQLNAAGQSPSALNCAQITIGTQEGNYADIVGALTGPQPVRLFALNQAKELFPDAENAAPLIAPNQKVYLRVVATAGAPISKQLAVARVKGHVL